jgi:polysaccharide chain length determinant protein (PEP-CTERM system associated)
MQRRPPSDIEDFLAIAARQWQWLLVPFAVIAFCTFVISVKLPRYYKSESVILVDPQKLPPEIVKSSGENVSGRLQVIMQQVLSRTQLEKIIAQFGLYKDRRLSKEDTVEAMRKDVNTEILQANVQNEEKNVSAFKVSYTGRSPEEAQNVTRQLASLFIEENLKVREQVAEGTHEFVDSELQRAREELGKQEEQIRAFKSKYSGMLPEQQQANLQVLGQLQQMLQANAESLSRAQQNKQYLLSLAEATKTDPELSPQASRLESLKAELVTAQQKYTDSHPDVIRLKAEIAALKNGAQSAGKASSLPQMSSQIRAAEEEIKVRSARANEIEAKIRGLQARIETLPAVEQQFSSLSRDYEVSRANYESLLQKRNLSSMQVQMERNAKGENFRILDPASYPERPTKPNLLQLNAMGIALGLGVGGGLVLLREVKDPSIHSERDLQFYVPLRVLGSLPVIATRESLAAEKRRRVKLIAAYTSASVVAIAIVGVLAARGAINVRMFF